MELGGASDEMLVTSGTGVAGDAAWRGERGRRCRHHRRRRRGVVVVVTQPYGAKTFAIL